MVSLYVLFGLAVCVITVTGNSQDQKDLLLNFYKRFSEEKTIYEKGESEAKGKTKDHPKIVGTVEEDLMTYNNTIRNLTIKNNIKNLLDILPETVALSKQEALEKKDKLEKELDAEGRLIRGSFDTPDIPMPEGLLKNLSRYINTTSAQKASCSKKATKIQTPEINVLENKLKGDYHRTRCEKDELKSFSCSSRIETEDLGSEYYPHHFIHEKCSDCKKCVYGTGRCKQNSIRIIVYKDEEGDGLEELYKWKEEVFTVYTGCTCLMTSDTAIFRILDSVCGNEKQGFNCF